MRAAWLTVLLLVLGAAPAAALTGPDGVSADKVLVIGIDGTRWDKLEGQMASGHAPYLRSLTAQGFGVSTLLAYQPPAALTLSEVGWSTIATGVNPDNHGVRGYALNNDPGQATKNGYPDFLSAVEAQRPELSTFLASDWPNIGLHQNGGPIFGDAIDARFAVAAEDTIESYDALDQMVTDEAADYLRRGNPDAGFVYLGVVDESAHARGSATDAYTDAIRRTDRRVGEMLSAIHQRRTYRAERWTILVTTDHGQQDLDEGSTVSHGGGSTLERTSFVIGQGFGGLAVSAAQVVDIAPTVLARLRLAPAPMGSDGTSLAGAPGIPGPSAVRDGRVATVTVPLGAPDLTRVSGPGVRRATVKPRTATVRLRRKGRTPLTVTDADGRRTVLRP